MKKLGTGKLNSLICEVSSAVILLASAYNKNHKSVVIMILSCQKRL